MKKFLLALLFAVAGTPALAQAPPPVPALPDTERAVDYILTSSTCVCAVPFAIYGDGTDVDNWIQVYNGTTRYLSTDPKFGWSLSSATGPLNSIPRPITNAVLTFNNPITATIEILGARRPRRLSQFTEGQGVAARDLNQVLTDIIAQNRENWDAVRTTTGNPSTGIYVTGFPNGGTNGHCAVWNASGDLTDAGIACQMQPVTVINGGNAAAMMFPGTNTFYINSSTGNDSNDCQSDPAVAPHGPCLTLQHGVDIAMAAAGGGFFGTTTTLFINGHFTTGAAIQQPNIQAQLLYMRGFNPGGTDSIDDTTGVDCGTLTVTGAGNVLLDNITIKKTVSCGGGDADIFIQQAYVQISPIHGPVTFGPSVVADLRVDDIGIIELISGSFPFNITGARVNFFTAGNGGELLGDGATITCLAGATMTGAWFSLSNLSTITHNLTYSGCASIGGGGAKFNVTNGAVIDMDGGLITNIPGTGGFYSYGAQVTNPPARPTLGTCTNGTLNTNSSDDVINVSFSGSTSTCSVNFRLTKANNPVCTASANVPITGTFTSTTTVTVTASFVSTDNLFIICRGLPN